MKHRLTTGHVLIGLATTSCLLLTACGGSSSSSSAATSTPPSTSATPTTSGRQVAGLSSDQLQAIETCLQSAGIALPTQTARPTEHTGSPQGGGGGQAGGAQALLKEPQVQAALKACGIPLPTVAAPGAGSTAAATAP